MPAGAAILRCSSCGTLNRVPVDRLADRPVCGKCRSTLRWPAEPVPAAAASFDRELNDWQELLLVEFWSPTCGYCMMAEPVVRDLARWKAGRLKVLLRKNSTWSCGWTGTCDRRSPAAQSPALTCVPLLFGR